MTNDMLNTDSEDAYVGRWVYPGSDDPLEMVGRKGVHDLNWLSDYIAMLLQLSKSDRVLDLCCGNGILTVRIAPKVQDILGVDFSEVLLGQARRIAAATNIEYRQGDARAIVRVAGHRKFDKVLISAAFQYFDRSTARELLSGLSTLIEPDGLVAVLDVPDRVKKVPHYLHTACRLILPEQSSTQPVNRRYSTGRARLRTIGRYAAFLAGLRSHSDLGWWWRRSDLVSVAVGCDFDVEIFDQPKENPHHFYRFDALLRRVSKGSVEAS